MFDSKKAIQELVYLVQFKGGMMDINMALAIVWLADRQHSRKFGYTITGDEYIATEQGIFPAELNKMIRKSVFSGSSIKAYFEKYLNIINKDTLMARNYFDNNILSSNEIHSIREICNAVGKLAMSEITDIRNFFSEWVNGKPFSDKLKSNIYEIDEVDFLLDIDKNVQSSRLIEIFSNERNDALNSDNLKMHYM